MKCEWHGKSRYEYEQREMVSKNIKCEHMGINTSRKWNEGRNIR
jgi:hypothetical protein